MRETAGMTKRMARPKDPAFFDAKGEADHEKTTTDHRKGGDDREQGRTIGKATHSTENKKGVA